ncbi:MAG: precorrin-4 C(11)-methyltransferase [Actinomycetota bacterium]|nr:precorrin-4 C(11)-methyltransferase [Actinomycetota bacterium]
MISFVGAGPGATDLITIRGADRLARADVVVWAGSLVAASLVEHCRPGAVLHDSSRMALDEVLAVFAAHPDDAVVRLHSGDPTVYSAVAEQIDWCRANGRPFEIVPGVSSVSATAAAAGRELTVPGVAQTVVHTRLARRTAASVPDHESVAALARQGATMALYLSAGDPEALQRELLCEGSAYTAATPVVIGYKVSWPDEIVRSSTLGRLAEDVAALGTRTSVMILVGDALADADVRAASHVYSASFGHAFRPAR